MNTKTDNLFQEFNEPDSAITVTETPSAFDAPPEGHRIRVDPDDLEKEPGETDVAFSNRQREYATAPDQFSPTGRKKGKIYLYDWDVKCIGKNKLQPARIKGVPAAPDAIREFLLLRGIPNASQYRFRAFPVAGTKRDAGDKGYPANHRPEILKSVPGHPTNL